MKPLKLGVIGSGFITRFQTTALKQVRSLELAGITERRGTPAILRLARELGMPEPTVYKTIGEMARNVDCIAIYAPNEARIANMEEVVAARKKGAELKGVICEKPLGRTVAEARRLVELAASADLRTAYFENQLFMKSLRRELQQLEPVTRAMGPVALVRSAEEHAGPHEPWFWDPRRQGGGVLSDMGCHTIAVGWFALTPPGKEPTFLRPESVSADVALLKWGEPKWREKLLRERGVDYGAYPAEDFATGVITFRNPETGQKVKAQFTSSWMFDRQGMRLYAEGLGPGYAFEVNTLVSSSSVFVGDDAAESVRDVESTLEKATASRGFMPILPNEADLYGYTDENEDAAEAFRAGRDAMLPWSYGLEITRLVSAAYMAAEQRRTIDLTDPATDRALESYISLIQQGRGREVL